MKILKASDAPLFPAEQIGIEGADRLSVRPLVTPADGASVFSLSVLELAPGGSTPDHSHLREEVILVQTGEGVVRYPDGENPVLPGSVLFFGPNEQHQFVNTGDGVLSMLCVTQIERG